MRVLWSYVIALICTAEAGLVAAQPAQAPPAASTNPPAASEPPAKLAARAGLPAPVELLARIPAGRAQPALAFGRRGSEIVSANCSPRCNWKGAVRLDVPPELTGSFESHVRTVKLGKGRRAAIVRAPLASSEWAAVLVADAAQIAPRVLFSGQLGLSGQASEKGVEPTQLRLFDEGKHSQVVLGRLDAELQLCGRETLLEPKLLLPDDLRMHRVKLQRLSKSVRSGAITLTARPGVAQAPRASLRGRGASSGADSLGRLLDGDARSAWTETRSGSGRGEFVVFDAAPNVPLAVVNVILPPVPEAPAAAATEPPGAPPPSGLAAPTAVWLVTDHSVFRVVFEPGGTNATTNRYQIYLPAPEQTSCVAIALEAGTSEHSAAQVGLTEVSVTAALPPDQVAKWVAALSEEPKTPGEPEVSLAAVSELAAPAIQRQFQKLGADGQVRALNVLDQWSCEDSAAGYALAWPGFSERVAPRLQACGAVTAPAVAHQLMALLPTDPELAKLLTTLDPVLAVETLVPLLGQKKSRGRAAARGALRGVAEQKSADPAIVRQLGAPLKRRVRLELLRALLPELPRFRSAALPAIKSLLKGKPSFRTRYLVIEPAAQLAAGDAVLSRYLTKLIAADIQFPIRAHAVRSAPHAGSMNPALLAAVEDDHVRVRVAAVEALGARKLSAAEPALIRRLEQDRWPLVRAAAVRALAVLENTPQSAATARINSALAETAEDDPAPDARRPAIVALGQRRAGAQVQTVRESFDVDEDVHVRAAAAEALGALCDHSAADGLTNKALQLGTVGASEETYIIGRSSLRALGRLNPHDLKQRLAPLLGEKMLRPVQTLARAALAHPAPCEDARRAQK